MIIGVDRGTAYTKNSLGDVFKSTVRKHRETDIHLDPQKHIVVDYKGEKYVIGEDGNYQTNLQKSSNEHTKLLVLVSLARATNESFAKFKMITGLPIARYAQEKKLMKSIFDKNEIHAITVNGEHRKIHVEKHEVYPESAGAFAFQRSTDTGIVIELGGVSVDVSLFTNKELKKFSTYPMGMMKLYSKIANYLNSKYDLSYTEWDIPSVLANGLDIYGRKQTLDIGVIVAEHVKAVIERLELEYDVKTNKVLLAGGGFMENGELNLVEAIKKYLPHATTIEPLQFANALGYEAVGRSIWD